MARTKSTTMIESFVRGRSRGRPMPLKSTSYEIDVLSGLVVVRQRRVFRNDERVGIEAVMTFPVAFEAVVTRLVAEVDGRRLKGVAVARTQARETYEAAVDAGKAAVLHEELLPGIHMVSVANVAPGAQIAVEATYVMPISLIGGVAQVRVPQTVGCIYGTLPLDPSDQLTFGGETGQAQVKISKSSGTAFLNGVAVDGRSTTVALDDRIDVRIEGLALDPLRGHSSDGRSIALRFSPQKEGVAPLDFDLLVDVSSSMAEAVDHPRRDHRPCNGLGHWHAFKNAFKAGLAEPIEAAETKWDALKRGVRDGASVLRVDDTVRLWSFARNCVLHGSHPAQALPEAIDSLPPPYGGTRLVEAVDAVVDGLRDANILLVTDGRSVTGTKLDIQRILATGARVTVVLVGAGALEARVGHLAARSGGQMFVVHGSDMASAVRAAMSSMRSLVPSIRGMEAPLVRAERTIAGMSIVADWGGDEEGGFYQEHVGAFAASLALADMEERSAGELAAAEGLVTHLTSIVLVDEEGAALQTLPEQRKVSLPVYGVGTAPRVDMAMSRFGGERHMSQGDYVARIPSFFSNLAFGRVSTLVSGAAPARSYESSLKEPVKRRLRPMGARSKQPENVLVGFAPSAVRPPPLKRLPMEASSVTRPSEEIPGVGNGGYDDRSIKGVGDEIKGFEWHLHVASLTSEQPWFDDLPFRAASIFVRVGLVSWIQEAARALGRDPRKLAVGLLAALSADGNRFAARIARRLLDGVPSDAVETLKIRLAKAI